MPLKFGGVVKYPPHLYLPPILHHCKHVYYLRLFEFDGVEKAGRKTGELRVPDGVDRCGTLG